ncbi:hypothetical protein J437_LFUL014083 [Ladona fulva]|uniref:Uncharacterized protein n=1 Tax=Ladona fulva TaxID=123851 RepID=A0A8K0KLH9_LADFU|nr:hypothetical protein J437_LFUL014083 [Ladona fulva]
MGSFNQRSEIKGLGGRGKLTGKLINELTVNYGLAISRNSDSVEKMKHATWTTFFHNSSIDEEPMTSALQDRNRGVRGSG